MINKQQIKQVVLNWDGSDCTGEAIPVTSRGGP
jgi:hypothetical protein